MKEMSLSEKIAETLCAVTNEFYRSQCDSFSESRNAPWKGWQRCLDVVLGEPGDDHLGEPSSLSVFDLACGNLRFKTFLESALPQADIAYYGVDTCDSMVPKQSGAHYQSLDILEVLKDSTPLSAKLSAPPCDLSVSFGFMHHIPLQSWRQEVLETLVSQTKAGGYVILSFWQFLNNEDMAQKAQAVHEQGLKELGLEELDANDYLLGWKNTPGVYRYCHSFTNDEIDQLVASVADQATEIARFTCDGRTDNLNAYVVLETKML